ncbi:MAG: cyclase family protein [Acidobacteriota bacterium]|nr:cyclase family protein [Acidobacteriota bacterium]
MHHTHKLLLAFAAAVLVAGVALLWNKTSHAPESGEQTPGQQSSESAKSEAAKIDEAKLVDLTYSFDDKTVYWPTAKPFEWQKESWGKSAGGYWYTAARYSASEHGGTHLDAPIHFGEGKQAADEIPLTRLVGPAIVIDIAAACSGNADYQLSAADIAAWEMAHGKIPGESIVLVRTGWGKFWPDKKKYLGTDAPGDTANLHFPGISREAAELLAARKIEAIGIDTASIDHGQTKDFITHQVLNGANVYGLENVANLDRLPAKGATLIALPMKIKGGTGAPARIVALLP